MVNDIKLPPLEIYKTLVVSSSHLSEEVVKLLDPEWRKKFRAPKNPGVIVNDSVLGFLIDRTGTGWRVYINMEDETPEEVYAEWRGAGLPNEFITLVKLAVSQECMYLELHMDGPVIEGYPRYDW